MSDTRIVVGLDLGREQDYSALAIGVLDPEPFAEPPPPVVFHPIDGGAPFRLGGVLSTLALSRDNRERPREACPKCHRIEWRRTTDDAWACERCKHRHGEPYPPPAHDPTPDGTPLRIQHLQRWPLRSPYTKIVGDVAAMMKTGPVAGARLLIDGTGVGAAVADLLTASGVEHELVVVTGGVETTREGRKWKVPKRDLVGAVNVMLQGRRLKVAASLPDAATLTTELQNFTYKISDLGHDSYGVWREGKHDDLVFATALCCWSVTKPTLTFGFF